ncbi:MAG TPA: bacteriorhodopsin [Propionibacteriaceae bacterium]|jgi:bacteriorhodopsin
MNEESWFWVGAVGMALGAIALFTYGKRRTSDEESHTVIHVLVPIVAACSYLAMARGQGGVEMPDGHVYFYARYIDWSITTPLLLLGLCITALHGAHRRPALVAAVLGADIVMIAAGFLSGISTDPTNRWLWFLVSCGAFLALYAALFGPLLTEARARDSDRRASYVSNTVVLAVLWLLYPVVVLLGPDGTGVWSATTNTACLAVVDLLSKIGYGFLTTATTKKVADADLAKGEVSPALTTTHGVPSDAGVPPAAP